jgi:hypothetical protein
MRLSPKTLLLVAITFFSTAFAAHPDLIVGTWELNVAQSTFPPDRAPKSQTRTSVQVGDEIRTSATGVRFDGVRFEGWSWSTGVHPDGKDRAMTGNPNYDTIAEKSTDELTSEFVQKKDGKAVLTGKRVMSKDGKTMTISVFPVHSTDTKPASIWVFEKK